MIDDVKAGTFGGKTYWAGITNGGLDIALLHAKIPPEVREKVEQAKKAIIKGKILVKVPSITEHSKKD